MSDLDEQIAPDVTGTGRDIYQSSRNGVSEYRNGARREPPMVGVAWFDSDLPRDEMIAYLDNLQTTEPAESPEGEDRYYFLGRTRLITVLGPGRGYAILSLPPSDTRSSQTNVLELDEAQGINEGLQGTYTERNVRIRPERERITGETPDPLEVLVGNA